mmetsp:Transcript_29459/g.50433  ORF Transcript_29459/g.50433 Transcript_29459/m.50433 type:complete len:206 (-) Transcript_29459:1153-1770(-)
MHTRNRSSSSVKSFPRLLPYLICSVCHGLSVDATLLLRASAIFAFSRILRSPSSTRLAILSKSPMAAAPRAQKAAAYSLTSSSVFVPTSSVICCSCSRPYFSHALINLMYSERFHSEKPAASSSSRSFISLISTSVGPVISGSGAPASAARCSARARLSSRLCSFSYSSTMRFALKSWKSFMSGTFFAFGSAFSTACVVDDDWPR